MSRRISNISLVEGDGGKAEKLCAKLIILARQLGNRVLIYSMPELKALLEIYFTLIVLNGKPAMVCCSLVRECQSRQFGWRTIQRLFPLVNRSAFMKVHGMVWASTTNEPVSYVVSEDLQPNTPRSEPVISTEDYKWVERLLPKALIPDVPLHRQFPTPSGWIPPKDRCAHCRYYVRRNRFHLFPVYSEIRRDTLNPETLEFSYVEIAILKKVEGDVFACEKDLTDFLEKRLGHPVATHVNEPQGKIRVRGATKADLEAFLLENGF